MRMIAIIKDLTPAPLRLPQQIIYFDAESINEARDKVRGMLKDKWADRTFTVDFGLITFSSIQISV